MQPVVRLVALGVQYDLLGLDFDTLTAKQRDAVLAAHPRTKFPTGMIEALAAGARDKPETAVGDVPQRHSRSDRARLRATQRLRRDPELSLRDVMRRGLRRR